MTHIYTSTFLFALRNRQHGEGQWIWLSLKINTKNIHEQIHSQVRARPARRYAWSFRRRKSNLTSQTKVLLISGSLLTLHIFGRSFELRIKTFSYSSSHLRSLRIWNLNPHRPLRRNEWDDPELVSRLWRKLAIVWVTISMSSRARVEKMFLIKQSQHEAGSESFSVVTQSRDDRHLLTIFRVAALSKMESDEKRIFLSISSESMSVSTRKFLDFRLRFTRESIPPQANEIRRPHKFIASFQ